MRRFVRYCSALLAIGVFTSVSLVLNALPTQSIGTWASQGALGGVPSGAATVTLADDRALVIGGMLSDGTTTRAISVYDAQANAFLQIGELASARSGHAAVLLPEGRVLVIGGGVNDAASAEIELFDPATGLSAIVASMTEARARHAAALLSDGRVLIVGGVNSEGIALASAEMFDVAGSTTPIASSMSTARAGLTATTLLDGQVLVAGGNDGTNDLASAEIYSAISQTFFPATTALSVARSGHAAVLLPHNGGVLIAGGSSEDIVQHATDLFLPPIFPDPYSYGMGVFVATGDLVEARVGAAAGGAGVDGYAVAAGGGAQSAEVYRFATVKTDKDDYAPEEPALITGTGWARNSKVTLLFQEDPPVHADYTFDVPTDGDGNFSTDDWAPELHDLNVRFYLTVSDGSSRAQTTFTDAFGTNTVLTSSQNPSNVGDSVTFTATVTQTAAGGGTPGTVVTVGTVTFRQGVTCNNTSPAFGTNVPVNSSGVATASKTFTSPGTFAIRACYQGTGGSSGSQDSFGTLSQEVTANTAPVLDPIGNRSVVELTPLTFTATATDTGVLTFSLSPGTTSCGSVTSCAVPGGASINSSTGIFSWTPTEAQGPGTYRFKVVVTDDGSTPLTDSEEITVTVNEANTAPVLNAIGAQSVNEGSLLSFTATATDSDTPPNGLTFSLDAGAPAGAAITPAGAFTWTPTEAQGPGSYPVTVRVTDDGAPAANDFETITITVGEVNVAPVLGAIGNKIVNEQTALTFTATATDADDPANALAFALAAGTTSCGGAISCAVPSGATISSSTGAFSWTPTEAQGPGTYQFKVVVSDDATTPLSDDEEITVTVNEVNLAPVLAPVGNKIVNELTALTFTATATDADDPANVLAFALAAGTTSCGGAISCAVPSDATINSSTGAFSWTPTEAQGPGTYRFKVVVSDDATTPLSDDEEITVTVNEVNLAPVLGAIGNNTINEQTTLTFTATATDADDPANVLAFALAAGTTSCGGAISCAVPSGATINSSTGAFSWTPTEAQGPGTYRFKVVVSDDATTPLSDDEEITITVNEVNLAPVLGAIGNNTINEQTALTFSATATDADDPANVLAFSLAVGTTNCVSVTSCAVPSGATINSSTGVFSWTPTEAQGPGTYRFKVVVSDDATTPLSDDEEITVTVNEVNLAPVLAPVGNKIVNELTPLSFTTSATDADDPANVLAFALVAGTTSCGGAISCAVPSGATINSSTGAFSWTPTEAQGPGTYRFKVVVSDDATTTLSDDEEITVTVNEVNLAPVLAPVGNKIVNELTPLSFTASATDADLPPNALAFALAAGTTSCGGAISCAVPSGATINSSTGAFSWTPTEAQGPGTYRFKVVVSDDATTPLSDDEEITVTVNEVNLAPTLAPIGPKSVLLGNTLTFTGSATDPDIPANALSFSLDAGAPAGASVTAAGVFTWTPTAAQVGVHSITVRVTDNGVPSLSAAETITVTVQYSMCLLYDFTKSHKKGSTIPIKLYLCDSAGNNVSSPGTVVNATGVVKVDPSASSAVVEDSGNANPDFNFRYDAGLSAGGGYIFNLSTKTAGYNTGTWKVVFTVNGVASTTYFAPFDIR